MIRRLLCGSVGILLLLAAVVEAFPVAPRVYAEGHLASPYEAAAFVALSTEGRSFAALTAGERSSKQVARFPRRTTVRVAHCQFPGRIDSRTEASSFHEKRPLPRSASEDPDPH